MVRLYLFQYLFEFRVCGMFSFHKQNEFVAKCVVTTDYMIYLVTCTFVKHILLYFSDDCVCNIFIVLFLLFYLCSISLCSVPEVEVCCLVPIPKRYHISPT